MAGRMYAEATAPPPSDGDLPPPIPPSSVPSAPPHFADVYGDRQHIDENALACLRGQGFPRGLARAACRTTAEFPLRLWIVDNSGSMNADDGHRLVETRRKNDVRLVKCTRWAELRECVSYHCNMAALLRAPTGFRLLNHPGAAAGAQRFGVAEAGLGGDAVDDASVKRDLDGALRIVNAVYPRGVTPLTEHVLAIHDRVAAMAPKLRVEGWRVAVIIATDGLPSDDQGHGGRFISDQFVNALRMLGSLPVWIVIRLCTDDGEVVRFYEELDRDLELNVEVLDDFVGECAEVFRRNPWLNYSLPLHRCREMGFSDRILDLLDERALTKQELSHVCALLFGEAWDGVPDPDADWDGFAGRVEELTKREDKQWNPILKKVVPCIIMKDLHGIYSDKKPSIIGIRLVLIILGILYIVYQLRFA